MLEETEEEFAEGEEGEEGAGGEEGEGQPVADPGEGGVAETEAQTEEVVPDETQP